MGPEGGSARRNGDVSRLPLGCWVLRSLQPKGKGALVSDCLQKVKQCMRAASLRVIKLDCHRSNSQVGLGEEVWRLSPQSLAEKARGEKPGRMNQSQRTKEAKEMGK